MIRFNIPVGVLIVGLLSVGFWAITKPAPTELTEEQRRAITHKVRAEVMNGEVLYNMPVLDRPIQVSFAMLDPRNASETWCMDSGMGVHVNERMAAQNWSRFIKETVPHEVAHLLMCQMGLANWDQHDSTWSTIVRDQGSVPYPYHNYGE